MKVYIAKHYWKDGESATWESHAKLDKEIFKYLKQNYHNFVQDRPVMIQEGKYYIYLCYEDEVDIYGRKITNVTFFVSKTKVSEELCNKNYYNLELNVSNRQMKFFGIFLLFVGLFFVYYIKTQEEKSIEKRKTNVTTNDVNKSKKPLKKEVKISHNEAKTKEKEELNRYVENQFKDFNLSIKTYENFKKSKNKLKTIQIKIKGKNYLLNTANNSRLSKLKDLVNRYTKLMKNGLACNIDVIKNEKKVNVQKLLFNKKEIKNIKKKKYKIHIVTKLSKDIVDGILNIKEKDLISLFNSQVINREIDNGYSLQLKKLKGENNESQTE